MLKIRFASTKDIKVCNEVDKILGFKTKPFIFKEAQKKKRLIIAEENKRAIGYSRYSFLWGEDPFISMIRVIPEYQKRGIGKKMIEKIEKKLAKEGSNYLKVWLEKYGKASEIAPIVRQAHEFKLWENETIASAPEEVDELPHQHITISCWENPRIKKPFPI